MIDETRPSDELHDELLEGPLERFVGWIMRLPKTLQVVVGCGTLALTFLLGMLAWGIIVAILF